MSKITRRDHRRYKTLPNLSAPAGYVCLIRDVDYGNNFAFLRAQDPSEIDRFCGAWTFKTQLERIFEADDAAAAERELQQRYNPAKSDWFELNPAQRRELRSLRSLDQTRSQNRQNNRPSRAKGQHRRGLNWASIIVLLLIAYVVVSMALEYRENTSRIPGYARPSYTPWPTRTPTDAPTNTPTDAPTNTPTDSPTDTPTDIPTSTPTDAPTDAPTNTPTDKPTDVPTDAPTNTATDAPTDIPTDAPTNTPTDLPTDAPADTATATSTATNQPSATAAGTDASPAKYVVDTARNLNANIRACPRTSCSIVASLPAGAPVEVLGSVTGETVFETDVWFEIKLEDGSAYIHSALAEVSPPTQPSNANANLERFTSPARRYTRSRVNIRTGPGAQYPLVETVPADTALEIVGKYGDWYMIRRLGREVYIAGWLTHDAPLPASRETQDN